ncbi:predicted protein [Nematostella vectensis]|uniref:Rad50/SbcC-type AAA domain-containing protein n=1 Tax=Nematostella vectensis TaxID=45351 RepID=A7RWC6_NEMVE|nr:predicted protein [Nematostella vectensis]|eukprot:XP_001636300.1 predicted protein [Nematostella vectensis]
MSSIEKMQVCGIRSYSHQERCVIEFQKPLTLIVGHNGAGKTVAGEQEVKGQIKLKFKDVTGNYVVVTRTLVAQQKGKKLETRTMDGVIMREVHGQRQSISSKCAEINREMISFLGVSKAVLETVIFCHQEESNW